MFKYLYLLPFLFCSLTASGNEDLIQEPDGTAFEAELRMLEQSDEAAFRRAENVTARELQEGEGNVDDDWQTDTVSTSNAAVKKSETPVHRSDILMTTPTFKPRRVRSR